MRINEWKREDDDLSIGRDTLSLLRREMIIYVAHIKTNVIRALIFPFILIIIFSNLGSNSAVGITTAVVNYANNPASASFLSSLQSQNTLQITSVTDLSQAMSMLKSGSADLVVVILPTFPRTDGSNPSVQIYHSNSNLAGTAGGISIIEQAAAKYGADPSSATGDPQAASHVAQLVGSNLAYGFQISYKTFLIGGLIAMVAAFGAIFGGGATLISDRQLGNLKAFLITPVSKNAIILSKILYGTIVSVIGGMLALGLGIAMGGTMAMGIAGLPYILVLVTLISIGFSSFTVVLASRVKNIEAYQIFAQVIVMPLWFLSGAFFPVSSMPAWMQPISVVDPMTYATTGIRYVMLSGYYPLQAFGTDILALLLFFALGFGLSFILFKMRID
ncbi:MAG: ABC transporter permease [Candidatus Marsarchaeota archaeon]|nr:ABC transporter permease [Candidatus Marsarchaeota archaeon]